jgi:O-antigen chain-terminating methyltransferase
MLKRPVTLEDLELLERERAEADRRYNEALTALDRAQPRAPGFPALPPPEREQLARLNEAWKVGLGDPPPGRGLRTRLARVVWSLVAPAFERQQAFNSILVQHLNRTAEREETVVERTAEALSAIRGYGDALATFHSHLILYLQQVTLYVDTKDRTAAGSLMAIYEPAIEAVTDEIRKRWESMVAREGRFSARVDAVDRSLDSALDEFRSTLATLQQATLTIKRELQRVLNRESAGAPPADGTAPPWTAPSGGSGVIDSYKYVGFENRFRGDPREIAGRQADYVEYFAGARDVLDIGCGRGEFLELLRQAGIGARGLDLNHEMVEVCRARGLEAEECDALTYLSRQPDASLGGLFAAQVVEHLEPAYLMSTLDAAYHALRPGSRIVLETINPACWFAFFESYIRDLTHVRPIHPETLQYLLTASGFQRVEIRYRSAFPQREKLQPIALGPGASPPALAAVDTINANVERLNGLLFTYLDYAAVATRL